MGTGPRTNTKEKKKGMVSAFYRNLYVKLIPDPAEQLSRATKGCETLLDIGCGSDSPVRHCKTVLFKTGVDAYFPSVREARKNKTHNKVYHANILDIGRRFQPRSFDCVVAFDVIEHLEKKDGERLLRQMERLARKRVIVFTPNGFLQQGALYGNEFQTHRSGWTYQEMKDRGYTVLGSNGWKTLRGELAIPKIKPHFFGEFISSLTEPFVHHKPKYAFQIMCIKEIS